MKKSNVLPLALLAVSTFAAMPASASLITAAPAGTTTVLSTLTGTWSSAASVSAGGFNVFAPSGSQVWYGDSGYGLNDNGSWGNFAWVGGYCYSGACTATIDLGGLYSSAGGFMNYALSGGAPVHGSGGDPMIDAIAADGVTVLESYNLFSAAPISTPGGSNAGDYRGISRSSADIAFLRLSGSYLIAHDLTVSGTTVPEPAPLALLGIGLACLGAARRKQRS